MRRWGTERVVGLHEPQVNEHHLSPQACRQIRLRLLSFNIQVGNSTEKYRHYLTRGWQHLLPHKGRTGNLQKIGDLLSDFDLVALQEADGGSLRPAISTRWNTWLSWVLFRTGISNSTATWGAWHSTATACSAVSNPLPLKITLPGPKGRGAILVRFGEGPEALVVVMMHLALGGVRATCNWPTCVN